MSAESAREALSASSSHFWIWSNPEPYPDLGDLAVGKPYATSTTIGKYRNTFKVLSVAESIFEELRTLPSERLESVADYVYRMRLSDQAERKAALRRTAGTISHAEADAWEKAIDEDCEQIDGREW